jgi:hypothetical protein
MKFELIPNIGCIGCIGLLYDNDEDDVPELIANIFPEDLKDLKLCVDKYLNDQASH